MKKSWRPLFLLRFGVNRRQRSRPCRANTRRGWNCIGWHGCRDPVDPRCCSGYVDSRNCPIAIANAYAPIHRGLYA